MLSQTLGSTYANSQHRLVNDSASTGRYVRGLSLLTSLCALSLVACTEPKETTGIGSAAGGALGAGLGAIIGSQSGNVGSGLAIGAVAGAASGALIGNAFQAQQEAIRSQDEAIERQERLAHAQRSEIEELRRMNQDSPSPRGLPTTLNRSRMTPPSASASRSTTLPTRSAAIAAPVSHEDDFSARGRLRDTVVENDTDVIQRDLNAPVKTIEKPAQKSATLGDFENTQERARAPRASEPTSRLASEVLIPPQLSSSCKEAENERKQAVAASESPEKLFHLRRALRLCPESPIFHHELGKAYLAMKRSADAEYEFKQSLAVDPSFKPAQKSLADLTGGSNARF
jgi:outer membrane lipoprotein SlyB